MPVIVEALELARAVAATEPFRGLLAHEVAPAERNLEEYVRGHGAQLLPSGGHVRHRRGHRLRGRVLGTDGLIVADASLMPTIPRANTNLTVVAIAERVANLLSSRVARTPVIMQGSGAEEGDSVDEDLTMPAKGGLDD